MHNQKGYSHLILVAAVVVLLIGGVLYFINNKKNLIQDNIQKPSQDNNIDSLNSFKTYKNEELGYEFNYGTDSNIEDSKIGGSVIISMVSLSSLSLNEKVKDESYFNLEVFKQRECPDKASDLEDSKVSKITVSGMVVDLIEGYAAYNNYRRTFCIDKEGNTYWFVNEYNMKNSENVRNQSKLLFDQVVSSFKFE